MQGYIDGGSGGAHGDALHGRRESEVAEVEVYRGCHAANVYRPGCQVKDSRGAARSGDCDFIQSPFVLGAEVEGQSL